MNHETIAAYIADGKAVLGIEFGSTRIKAVLIGDDHAPIASGDHTWENRLEDGIWTYHLDDVWAGVQDAFANLQKDVQANYGRAAAAGSRLVGSKDRDKFTAGFCRHIHKNILL